MRSRELLLALVVVSLAACVGRIGEQGTSEPDPKIDRPDNPNKPDPTVCVPGRPPITPRLRRLTFAQYDLTVQTLTGVDMSPSTALGPEVDGVTPVLWSGIQSAAEAVAAAVIASPTLLDRILPCTPTGDGTECATQFVTEFGRRAYRRPLTPGEVASYMNGLWAMRTELTENGTWEQSIGLLLEAMLQAPTFLLRVEASAAVDGDHIVLSGYERATRMSYALWNAPPDAELLAAAERGDLDTTAGVRTAAQRMLTSPEGVARARRMLLSAHADWLGMAGAYAPFWYNTQRDPNLFPEFVPGIDADFRNEVLLFLDTVAFDRAGSFRDLMTSNVTMVNDTIAPIYQLSGSYPDWTAVELDNRPGLLTRAGFVGTHGRYGRGSLIFRGAFVLKRLLCEETGSPPAGADATPLPESSENLVTERQRVEAMTAGQPCAGCHTKSINPAGFALESFDGIGRVRTEDNGAPVDTTGTVTIDGMPVSYSGAVDYAAAIADSKQAHQCYVDRFTEFTFGAEGVRLDCGGGHLSTRLGDPSVSLTDFLVDLVSDDNFLYRATEEAP